MRFSFVVSQYLLGTLLGDSHYLILRIFLSYDMNQVYMAVGPLRYTNASYASFTFGDSYYVFMVNGNGSLTIVDICWESDLTYIEFVSLGKV